MSISYMKYKDLPLESGNCNTLRALNLFFVKAQISLYSPFINAMSSKSVTKLVLLAEIVAICILHSVKISHTPKPQQADHQVSYDLQKKFVSTSSISFTTTR